MHISRQALRLTRRDCAALSSSTWRRAHTIQVHTRLGHRSQAASALSSTADSAPAATELLQQAPGSWVLQRTAVAAPGAASPPPGLPQPLVAIVDGTNLACLSASSRRRWDPEPQSLGERFADRLRFIRVTTAADLVIVAFDNKGSAAPDVRSQLHGDYLRRRHQKAAAGHLPPAVGGAPTALVAAARALGCVVVPASPGYEADDAMAATVAWLRERSPASGMVLISSDSDMQQLLAPDVYWLEVCQAASLRCPSGLHLHSSCAFEAAHGYPASCHGDVLALLGKKEAGVTSVGLSLKVARALVTRVGSAEAIAAAAASGDLTPFPQAHKVLSTGPCAEAARAKLLRNAQLVRMRPSEQNLPEEGLAAAWEAAVQGLAQQKGQRQHQQQMEQQQEEQQQEEQQQRHQHQHQHQHQPKAQALSRHSSPLSSLSAAVALLHPVIKQRARSCKPYIHAMQQALSTLGLASTAHFVTPEGLVCDLALRLYTPAGDVAVAAGGLAVAGAAGSSNGTVDDSSDCSTTSASSTHYEAATGAPQGPDDAGCSANSSSSVSDLTARDGLVLMILGPGDFTEAALLSATTAHQQCAAQQQDRAAGPATAPLARHVSRRPAEDVELLAEALRQQFPELCGGALRRGLKAALSGGTRRQLSLLKDAGWRTAVVPFYELPGTAEGRVQYVQALLVQYTTGAGVHCVHGVRQSV